MNTRLVGKKGEDFAVRYLKRHGYKILQRNYLTHMGEIDVVAQEGGFVVFIEVKARAGTSFGLPREAVTDEKQRTIVVCSKLWLVKNKKTGVPVRFDVVEILDGEVNVIKDAFRA